MHRSVVVLGLALALPATALRAEEAAEPGWTGTGELGLALARGNAKSENLNTKLNFRNEDAQWKHQFSFAALRAKGESSGDFDGDGVPEQRFELNANRYEAGASSALKMNERAYWVGALRYENDDFAPFEHQTTFSLGYGYTAISSETTSLSLEAGPGYRRAKNAASGETETDTILRAQVDFQHQLTENTQLGNLLLLESGADNTFVQNDLGLKVAMNSKLALKASLQVRNNSEVAPGTDKTDTLTTVNLVYTFR
jgi:putative salt-induced outer membrane protein